MKIMFWKYVAKFTGEPPCGSVISKKLQNNIVEFTPQHAYSPVNRLNIFKTLVDIFSLFRNNFLHGINSFRNKFL